MGKIYGVYKMTDGRVEQIHFNPTPHVQPSKVTQILAALGYTPKDFDLTQVVMGVNEELEEHGDVIGTDETKAVKIAIAHLKSVPDYYTKMKAVMGEEPKDNSKARAEVGVI